MPRPFFGYRIDQATKKPVIVPEHAAIVAAVLATPYGHKSNAAGDLNVSVFTRDSRRRSIMAHAKDYKVGRARSDMKPDPALVIKPAKA